jgi:hypothetical protein
LLLLDVQDLVDQIDGYFGIEIDPNQYEQVICENVGTTADEIKEAQLRCIKASSAIYSSSIFDIVRKNIISQAWVETDPNCGTEFSLVAREQEFFSEFKWGNPPSPTDFQDYCEWIKEELTKFLALNKAYYTYREWHDEIQTLYDTREGYKKDSLDYIDDVESTAALAISKGWVLDKRIGIMKEDPYYFGEGFTLSQVVLGAAKPYTSKSFPARPDNYEAQKNLLEAENAAILRYIGDKTKKFNDARFYWFKVKIEKRWTPMDPNNDTTLHSLIAEEASVFARLTAGNVLDWLNYYICVTDVLADFIDLIDAYEIYREWRDEIQALYDTREGYKTDSLDYMVDIEINAASGMAIGWDLDDLVDATISNPTTSSSNPYNFGEVFPFSQVVLGFSEPEKPYTFCSFPDRPDNYETQKELLEAENAAILRYIADKTWGYKNVRFYWFAEKIKNRWTNIDPNKNTTFSLINLEKAASTGLNEGPMLDWLTYYTYMKNVLTEFLDLQDAPTTLLPDSIALQDMPSLYQAQCI